MMCLRSFIMTSVSVLLAAAGIPASEVNNISIEKIFSRLSFRSHFPHEKELVAKYGGGVVGSADGERYRIYYLPKNHLWLRLQVDAENRIESPVTGVLLSKLPLCSERRVPQHEVSEITLRGIRLGEPPRKAEKIFGKPLREYKADLGPNRNLTVIEFFPKTLEVGSCVRIYVKDGAIAAFSFSSEE